MAAAPNDDETCDVHVLRKYKLQAKLGKGVSSSFSNEHNIERKEKIIEGFSTLPFFRRLMVLYGKR